MLSNLIILILTGWDWFCSQLQQCRSGGNSIEVNGVYHCNLEENQAHCLKDKSCKPDHSVIADFCWLWYEYNRKHFSKNVWAQQHFLGINEQLGADESQQVINSLRNGPTEVIIVIRCRDGSNLEPQTWNLKSETPSKSSSPNPTLQFCYWIRSKTRRSPFSLFWIRCILKVS